jgi:hypothetical protein
MTIFRISKNEDFQKINLHYRVVLGYSRTHFESLVARYMVAGYQPTANFTVIPLMGAEVDGEHFLYVQPMLKLGSPNFAKTNFSQVTEKNYDELHHAQGATQSVAVH